MCPRRTRAFSPSEGERPLPSEGECEWFRRSCGADAGSGDRPLLKGWGFSPTEGECLFLPPSAAGNARAACGEIAAFGGGRTAAGRQPGIAASRRQRAKGGTGHPDLRPGFLYPLLRLPLTFRSAAQRSFAAKKRGPQLRPLCHRRQFDAVWGWLAFGFALDFRA